MPICIYSEFQLGDIIVRYLRSGSNLDTIGLVLVPATCANDVVTPRECLDASYIRNLPSQWQPVQAWNVDSLVHVHVRGDPLTGGFGQGRTMRDGKSTSDLRFRSQVVKRHGKTTFIRRP